MFHHINILITIAPFIYLVYSLLSTELTSQNLFIVIFQYLPKANDNNIRGQINTPVMTCGGKVAIGREGRESVIHSEDMKITHYIKKPLNDNGGWP